METGIDGFFQFNDDVFKRGGGFFEVREFLGEEFVTLFRLLEFPDDLVAAPDARLLYLYIETLDIAPPFFLHTTLFRKCARRDLRLLPRMNCRTNKRYSLTHLFLEPSA